jgi:hypothetical protein
LLVPYSGEELGEAFADLGYIPHSRFGFSVYNLDLKARPGL